MVSWRLACCREKLKFVSRTNSRISQRLPMEKAKANVSEAIRSGLASRRSSLWRKVRTVRPMKPRAMAASALRRTSHHQMLAKAPLTSARKREP